jgi:hypothetical protein
MCQGQNGRHLTAQYISPCPLVKNHFQKVFEGQVVRRVDFKDLENQMMEDIFNDLSIFFKRKDMFWQLGKFL